MVIVGTMQESMMPNSTDLGAECNGHTPPHCDDRPCLTHPPDGACNRGNGCNHGNTTPNAASKHVIVQDNSTAHINKEDTVISKENFRTSDICESEGVVSTHSVLTPSHQVQSIQNSHQVEDMTQEQGGDDRCVTPPIPKGTEPLSHQVAGHVYGKSKTKLGFLQGANGAILKPVQSPPRGERELRFYQDVFAPDCQDPTLLKLREFLPKYLGTAMFSEHPGVTYFKMEDLTRRFRNPCIMDIKIGPITYDPEATPAKRKRGRTKYPFIDKVGFQLLGIRSYRKTRTGYEKVHYDKSILLQLDEHQVLEKGLAVFSNTSSDKHRPITEAFLRRLAKIEKWFESQKELHFFASSLLMVYEGDAILKADAESENCDVTKNQDVNICRSSPVNNGDNSASLPSMHCAQVQNGCLSQTDLGIESKEGSEAQNDSYLCTCNMNSCSNHKSSVLPCDMSCDPIDDLVDIKMIDFTHMFPANGKTDDNYLFGLKNLIRNFKKLL